MPLANCFPAPARLANPTFGPLCALVEDAVANASPFHSFHPSASPEDHQACSNPPSSIYMRWTLLFLLHLLNVFP